MTHFKQIYFSCEHIYIYLKHVNIYLSIFLNIKETPWKISWPFSKLFLYKVKKVLFFCELLFDIIAIYKHLYVTVGENSLVPVIKKVKNKRFEWNGKLKIKYNSGPLPRKRIANFTSIIFIFYSFKIVVTSPKQQK